MKKMYSSFIAALVSGMLASFSLTAQIPNSGFENWFNWGSYLTPEGWWTPNDSASGPFYSVTRSTEHFPSTIGEYSIRLENNTAILPDWGGFGLSWTGDWNGNNYPVFPVSGHPNTLWGYYKFLPSNGDTMDIHIRLYQNGIDVSGGQFKSAAAAASWTPFMITISGYAQADSARIMISACYDNDAPVPHGNSVLYIDNLNFDSLISDGIQNPGEEAPLTLFPSLSQGTVTISFNDQRNNPSEVWVYSLTGYPVYRQVVPQGDRQVVIDLSGQPAGSYILYLFHAGGNAVSRKLILVH